MGVLAAFVFAAQMLNFAVAGGTSGHLIGGALVAILLGPWAGILTMTTVISVQALLFQDGGLLVMGANILDMGIVATVVGYGAYFGVTRLAPGKRWGLFAGGFAGAWLSVVASAAACALQLAFSGTFSLRLTLPAMLGVHMLIGIGEGLITTAALAFVASTRRDLMEPSDASADGLSWTAAGLALALMLTLLSPLASTHPDGLERVAQDLGFIEAARDAPYEIIPDYVLPGLSNQALATIGAGAVGTLVVTGVALAVAQWRREAVS
jgi:cobalt/nickel transport system permease protein